MKFKQPKTREEAVSLVLSTLNLPQVKSEDDLTKEEKKTLEEFIKDLMGRDVKKAQRVLKLLEAVNKQQKK